MKMNPIPYSQEELKSLFDYDEVTGELFWKIRKARCIQIGDRAGSYNRGDKKRGSYVLINLDGVQYFAHRIIWKWLYGYDPIGHQIDHDDNNGWFNAKNNLRISTPSQNGCNKGLSSANKTGVKGLCLINTGLLKAQVMLNGSITEKCFSNTAQGFEQAILWLEQTRERLHQQFTNHG